MNIYRYILLFLISFNFLLSNEQNTFLNVHSINDNDIKLFFDFEENDFENSNSKISVNALGLPKYNYILELPKHVEVEIEYFINDIKNIANQNQTFIFNNQIRKSEVEIYNVSPIFIGDELIKGQNKYISVSISPISKNNHKYTLLSEIEINIKTNQSISENQLRILNSEAAAEILSRNNHEDSPPVLLIIAPEGNNIYTLSTPFINWKKQKGYKVFYHSLDEIGTTNSDIKDFIQYAYDNWEFQPDYICIIGDADGPYAIPTFNESLSVYNGEGDHPYTLLEGNDNISDVAIGRLSIRTLSDLANILNKIISYEQTPYIGEINWFKRALCVGDASVSGVSTIITNQIISELMIENDYNEVLEVYQYPFVNQIENGINSGVSFYNYRGFAGSSGWQKDDADNLTNGYMLPIVSILTCDTGSFLEDEESTAENFLRTGSISIPRGGIAAIGMATQGTHTMFNNCLNYGLYHGIFVEDIPLLGDVVNYAKNNLWFNYPDNPNNYVEIFSHWMNLMGDPTLNIWTDFPKNIESSFNTSIPLGQNTLNIQVTSNDNLLDDALITITDQNYNLISQGVTNNGEANLNLNSDINVGSYYLTITKQNYIPLIRTFTVEQTSTSININDLNILNQNLNTNITPDDQININFKLFNYGSIDLEGIYGEVIINDDDIVIDNNIFTINNTITNNTSSDIITIQANIAANTFKKEINGSINIFYEEYEWNIPFSFMINGVEITPNLINSNGPYFLNSGINNMQLELQNTGYNSNPMQLIISSNSDFISINDDIINVPNISNNETILIDQGININVLDNAYPGLQIPITFTYLVDGNPMQIEYHNINFGQINSHSPLGPDEYGYYIYDDLDIMYTDAPVYEWIEIDPYLSGNGTILINLDDNGDNQDDVTFVNMPFDFQFYGQMYEQISISTNGWIKPGLTNQSSFRNWRLPGAGGPSPMIAAFWDDLQTDNGRICVDYDVQNHWYIIEWSSVRNGFDLSEETFQVIIYDQNYYPTITNDNIIKIQYKVFNNVNSGHYDSFNQWHGNYASIGIENEQANTGLEYTWNNQYPIMTSELSDERAILITTNQPYFLYSIIGDVNHDESVDILDIVSIIQVIINNENELNISIIGDVNFDENLNILDIVYLVNIILES